MIHLLNENDYVMVSSRKATSVVFDGATFVNQKNERGIISTFIFILHAALLSLHIIT